MINPNIGWKTINTPLNWTSETKIFKLDPLEVYRHRGHGNEVFHSNQDVFAFDMSPVAVLSDANAEKLAKVKDYMNVKKADARIFDNWPCGSWRGPEHQPNIILCGEEFPDLKEVIIYHLKKRPPPVSNDVIFESPHQYIFGNTGLEV